MGGVCGDDQGGWSLWRGSGWVDFVEKIRVGGVCCGIYNRTQRYQSGHDQTFLN